MSAATMILMAESGEGTTVNGVIPSSEAAAG